MYVAIYRFIIFILKHEAVKVFVLIMNSTTLIPKTICELNLFNS